MLGRLFGKHRTNRPRIRCRLRGRMVEVDCVDGERKLRLWGEMVVGVAEHWMLGKPSPLCWDSPHDSQMISDEEWQRIASDVREHFSRKRIVVGFD